MFTSHEIKKLIPDTTKRLHKEKNLLAERHILEVSGFGKTSWFVLLGSSYHTECEHI